MPHLTRSCSHLSRSLALFAAAALPWACAAPGEEWPPQAQRWAQEAADAQAGAPDAAQGALSPDLPDLLTALRWQVPPLDRLVEGSSAQVSDLFLGESTTIEWWVRNEGEQVREALSVQLDSFEGLAFEQIEVFTDAPYGDRRHWQTVEVERRHTNEPLRRILLLPALGAGHSLRVEARMRASAVAPVRSFKAALSQDTLSLAPRELPAHLLSPAGWAFEGPTRDDVEGWVPCDDGPPLLFDGVALRVEPGRCVASPAWTQINAAKWSGVGVQLEVQEEGVLRLWYARGSQAFEEQQRALQAIGRGHVQVAFDFAGRPEWRGEIGRLAIYTDTTIRLRRVTAQNQREAVVGAPIRGTGEFEPPEPALDAGAPLDAHTPQADGAVSMVRPYGAGSSGCQSLPQGGACAWGALLLGALAVRRRRGRAT